MRSGSIPSFRPRYTVAPARRRAGNSSRPACRPSQSARGCSGQRMNLQREIAAAHRVQEIEADRKLRAEALHRRIAQESVAVHEHNIERRYFVRVCRRSPAEGCSPPEHSRSTTRDWARRPRAERTRVPSSVRPTARGRRTAPRGRGALQQSRGPFGSRTSDHLRRARRVRVEQKIESREQLGFGAVRGTPVQEKGALVLQ